jgi:hypothetical protein
MQIERLYNLYAYINKVLWAEFLISSKEQFWHKAEQK